MDEQHQFQARIAAQEREINLLKEALRQADRIRQQWSTAIRTLQRTRRELAESNRELAILHNVARAVGEIGGLNDLMDRILGLMLDLVADPVCCGIFLVQGDKMVLAATRGASPAFLEAHADMRIGDCLCGQVAQHGEVHFDEDGSMTPQHTISYEGMQPHGHVILPLKANKRTVGVFYYHLPRGSQIPLRKQNLLRNIGALLGMAIDNASRFEEKDTEASHDALTGLANRRLLLVELERDWAAARRDDSPLSAVMFDIDFFKRYNDNHGHLEGDLLLRQIGEITRDCVRKCDLAVRYGGEEFLLLLRRTTIAQAEIVAGRLRQAVAAGTEVTVSFGISGLSRQDQTPWAMIQRADQALYEAKQRGRNQARTHPPSAPCAQ
ncbi:GGDEF domain-containing protein [Desulfurivibrio alkaliphilus]|uniref:diguanylate cyclase n=1 Tax=Desulfurivibrio alkaliphilus (strain DSM 19089 / UNIQEM U267 / AHT2) TaxID=589865 RepID=D6Z1R7_DESAT|nr:sensor domain-containing diguanylate cyclase [Desulfurivibrio alkaliphilus]ADH85492.1 diguanylate cyclase [Desulfurivibrio alkaliphilus AHT 2]